MLVELAMYIFLRENKQTLLSKFQSIAGWGWIERLFECSVMKKYTLYVA
jgi:hypothetical protein